MRFGSCPCCERRPAPVSVHARYIARPFCLERPFLPEWRDPFTGAVMCVAAEDASEASAFRAYGHFKTWCNDRGFVPM